MNKNIVVVTAIVMGFAFVGYGAWYFANSAPSFSETREPITIGVPPNEQYALLMIADDQGYFARNGLDVTLVEYEAGVAAVKGMEYNETVLSVSTEYPIVAEALKGEKISVIASIDKFQTVYVVGRLDRGLHNVSDLRGKKIGVDRGTIAEFYLGRFINLHGMNLQDTILVDMHPIQSFNALENGSVDAVTVTSDHFDRIKARFGGTLVLWPAQSDQLGYEVIAGWTEWIASHPETITNLLTSLDQAESYAIEHPDEAKAIVQKRLNKTDAYVTASWPNHQFVLSLDESLLLAMEDEAWWMIENNLTNATTVPDFREYISPTGLKQVRPESVTIP